MNIFMLQSAPLFIPPSLPTGLPTNTHHWILFSLAIAYLAHIKVKKKRNHIKLNPISHINH